jgi:hypothetical protein
VADDRGVEPRFIGPAQHPTRYDVDTPRPDELARTGRSGGDESQQRIGVEHQEQQLVEQQLVEQLERQAPVSLNDVEIVTRILAELAIIVGLFVPFWRRVP